MIEILLADDHRIFLDGIKSLLNGVEGINVMGQADNGQSAVDLACELEPDIVLMDIQMPVKNGIEATIEIVKTRPDIRVIALTMLNETSYIRRMVNAGCYGYILKTIDKGELIEVIRKVAAGEKHFGPEIIALLNQYSERAASSKSPIESLTKREKEILVLIAQGLTDKEIAGITFLSPLTIITHRKNMLSKLGLKNKVELTRFAFENNLVH